MNTQVFLLFLNAFLAVVIAAVIVSGILRKEYSRQIEEFEKNNTGTP